MTTDITGMVGLYLASNLHNMKEQVINDMSLCQQDVKIATESNMTVISKWGTK